MTVEQIVQANRDAGRFFFSPDTLRFFRSRVSSRTYTAPDGTTYFVTSEQGPYGPRRYTVRVTRDGKNIDTEGAFQAHRTAHAAHARARFLAHGK